VGGCGGGGRGLEYCCNQFRFYSSLPHPSVSNCARMYVVAAVCLNSVFLWDVSKRRLVKHRRFGTTYRSHRQVSKKSFSRVAF
jgi:hypothetical protein